MSRLNVPDTLGNRIAALEQRIARLENSARSAIAVVPADPANPRDGDVWLRTSDQTYRIRINGVTRTVTVP